MLVSEAAKNSYALYLRKAKEFRKIEKADEGRVRAQVLVLETKNNPPMDSYVGFFIDEADIGKVGKTFCDIFLIGKRKPMRFKHSLGRVLVK